MSIGTSEIFLCLVIALLVLGPEKLPGAARQVGRFMTEFKRITGDVQSQVQDFINEEPEDSSPPASPASTDPAPPVAGRPANAPDTATQTEADDLTPERKHPGTDGFRLIDTAAPKPATPQPVEPKQADYDTEPKGSNE